MVFIRNNLLSIILSVIVISIGVGVRYHLLESHFTHIDDIGVAQTILERDRAYKNIDKRYKTIWKEEVLNGKKGEAAYILGGWLNSLSALRVTYFFSRWWLDILHAVPSAWTYAPGQFYLTNILVSDGDDYSELKFWGRVPSFVFSIISFFLLIFVFKKMYPVQKYLPFLVVALTILSFSWENIIYSAQMESYAVGNFSILLMFVLLMFVYQTPPTNIKGWMALGMFAAIPGLFQYQALLFVLPLYVTLILFLKNNFKIKELIKYSLASFFGFLLIFFSLIYPYLKDNIGRGISSNIGPDGIFLLSIKLEDGIFVILDNIATFVFQYLPETIGSIFSPTFYNFYVNQIIGTVLVILSFVGLYSMLKSPNNKKIIAVFTILSLFVYFLALLFQAFPLSPTRHSIILGCLLLLSMPEGLSRLTNLIPRYNPTIGGFKAYMLVFVFTWILLFIPSIAGMLEERKDPFNEVEILNQLNLDDVDLIVNFDNSHQFYLMPSVIKKYPALDANLFLGSNSTMQERSRRATNYGANDNILINKSALNIAIFSGHTCFDFNKLKDRIYPLIERYNFYQNVQLSNIFLQCVEKRVEIEYSPRTKNGSNKYSYTVIKALKTNAILF